MLIKLRTENELQEIRQNLVNKLINYKLYLQENELHISQEKLLFIKDKMLNYSLELIDILNELIVIKQCETDKHEKNKNYRLYINKNIILYTREKTKLKDILKQHHLSNKNLIKTNLNRTLEGNHFFADTQCETKKENININDYLIKCKKERKINLMKERKYIERYKRQHPQEQTN